MTKLEGERRFTFAPPVMLQRVRVRFSRLGRGAELTHLQQIEMVRRVLREAGWSFKKISFGPAVSVGVESLTECCDVQLQARLDLKKGQEALVPHLPDGYALVDVKSIPRFFPSLEESINVSRIEIFSAKLEGTQAKWDEFWAAKQFVVIKKKADKDVAIDARELVKEWKLEGTRLELLLRFGPGKTLKPEKIVQAVCQLPEDVCQVGTPTCELKVKRLEFYLEKNTGELLQI